MAPLRIEIGGSGYKSIDTLVWDNVPPFAVLTGVNGAGKTQLLELLAYKLTDTEHPQLGNLSDVHVVVTGETIAPDAVAYLPNEWNLANPTLGIAEMQNAKQNLYGQLSPQNIRTDVSKKSMRARLERLLGIVT